MPAALAEIRSSADALSLQAPGGDVVVDDAWLADCRDGQVVVNTARADLVDEAAVAQALRDGRLFAFAADTLTTEGHRHGESPPAP